MAETSRDLILAPNQEAYVQDQTKGNLNVYVGPYKTSLAQTDQPVRFNPETGRYDKATLEAATFEFPRAVEGSYIVLENPARDDKKPHPPVGSSQQADLSDCRKVNIAGPAMFPLWPGQIAQVIEGHRLRSNQYLVVRVYNEDAARQNWSKAVQKPATQPSTETKPGDAGTPDAGKKEGTEAVSTPAAPAAPQQTPALLALGQLLVIKGTNVSFYIPPTGIEVVPDEAGTYVRDAATLERLEYCILLAESGAKRIMKGPDVVFPEPTETFVEKDGKRKFRAIELNDDMGIYVKVIAEYEDPVLLNDAGEKLHKAGDELFITGRQMRIYYPREEHAIIKYGDQERHYGVVIPEGEGRYLLNKQTGKIGLKKGPCILLCDPRKEVLVRRVLEDGQIVLWYPGNDEARKYNAKLRELVRGSIDGSPERALQESSVAAAMPLVRHLASKNGAQADEFQRGSSYNPPRTITLDTKYEGAVAVTVWSNYAVLITSKTGGRRVVVGPATALLEYDESLQVLELSTGKPKTTDKLERTCYLRVSNNQVSDILTVTTRDMVEVQLKLSYRVNFEGDSAEKWFAVENYVKFLCDRVRSLLSNAAKQVGIEDFNNRSIPIIRDAILGAKADAGGERAGLAFKENGMRVCDVEVLTVRIGDASISDLLVGAQNKSVRGALEVAELERSLSLETRKQIVQRQLAELKAETEVATAKLTKERLERQLAEILDTAANTMKRIEKEREAAEQRSAIAAAESKEALSVELAQEEQRLLIATKDQELTLAVLKAEVQAVADKAKAISPDLISALQSFADRHIATEAAKSMAPMALLGGTSVADVLGQLFKGTALEKSVQVLGNGTNGQTTVVRPDLRG